jgi:hypothetical protein
VRELKQRWRLKLIRANRIEELLSELPRSAGESVEWCAQFMEMYREAESHSLSADEVVSIFWLAEKHINRFTLELLELVVMRAPSSSLDHLFQYDVMKLLHTAMLSTHLAEPSLNRSCSSEESEAIIKEAVLPSNADRIGLPDDEGSRQRDLFEMVRTAMSTVGWLCRKSAHVRNFAVINHKTYTYCLKAYKRYPSLQHQFFSFLEAATHLDFQRNDEQFNRISAKILTTLFATPCNFQNSQLASLED